MAYNEETQLNALGFQSNFDNLYSVRTGPKPEYLQYLISFDCVLPSAYLHTRFVRCLLELVIAYSLLQGE